MSLGEKEIPNRDIPFSNDLRLQIKILTVPASERPLGSLELHDCWPQQLGQAVLLPEPSGFEYLKMFVELVLDFGLQRSIPPEQHTGGHSRGDAAAYETSKRDFQKPGHYSICHVISKVTGPSSAGGV